MKIETFKKNKSGDCYRTLEDYTYPAFKGCPSFTVPAGFEFDGASVPALLQLGVFSSGDTRVLDGALGHDFIYRTHPKDWTRKRADEFFYKSIRDNGISWWRAKKAYWGLRLFGHKAWEANFK